MEHKTINRFQMSSHTNTQSYITFFAKIASFSPCFFTVLIFFSATYVAPSGRLQFLFRWWYVRWKMISFKPYGTAHSLSRRNVIFSSNVFFSDSFNLF